ncbi:MAG TPA: hypothetical protein VH851_14990 [Candidatus Binatia bacterium]
MICVTHGAGGHNMVNPVAASFAERVRCSSSAAAPAKKNHKLDEAVRETVERLNHAKSPLILVGIESYRFKAAREIVARGTNRCPLLRLGARQGAFPMTHPQYMGVYFGAISPPRIRKRVEDADLIIALGMLLTDIESGGRAPS